MNNILISALSKSMGGLTTPVVFSVIIPCLNERTVIGRCLESLLKLDYDREKFEVIVVDNASKDGTVEVALAAAAGLNLVTLTCEEGRVTKLRNLGAASARGEFLAFLDADCLVPRGWLRLASEKLSADNAGIIGGHCGIPENSPWVPRIWYADRQTMKRGHVTYVPAANLLVSRRSFEEIGGFDESLETNEECELCERARKMNLTVIAYPELGVVHLRDPQTLWAFCRKHAWHGKNVFKVFLRNLPSLVNGRPVFFSIYTLFGVSGCATCLALCRVRLFSVPAVLLLLPSIGLSLRIAMRRRRLQDFPALVILHLAYGLARASALLNPQNWLSQKKTSERVNAFAKVPASGNPK